jgi:hypothetical protein
MKNIIALTLVGVSLATSSWGAESCRDIENQKIKDMSVNELQEKINIMEKIQENLMQYRMKMDDISGKYAWTESRKASADIFACATKINTLQSLRDKKNELQKTGENKNTKTSIRTQITSL